MTLDDARFKKEKERVRKLITKWQGPMGLRWFKVDLEFTRDPAPDGTHTQAMTNMASWRYHEFTITFYIPDTMHLSDEDLENTIIHELTHCLLAPISCNLRGVENDDPYRRDLMEFNTQMVTNAMRWVRNAGMDDQKAEDRAKAKSDTLKKDSKAKENSNARPTPTV